MLSLELKILFNAIQADCLGFEKTNIDTLSEIKGKVRVKTLFELAHHHGVIWQVVKFCQYHDLLSEQERLIAKRAQMITTAYSLNADQQLVLMVQGFKKCGISYALLKGAAIDAQFGKSQRKLSRSSADIDLLIDTDDLLDAMNILSQLGYMTKDVKSLSKVTQFIQRYPHWVMPRDISFSHAKEEKIDIDMHWKIAHEFSLPLQTKVLLENLETIEVEGCSVQTLSFEDHFLLLCIHGYLDRFFLLKHLADIYYALNHPRFDEKKMIQYADKNGVKTQIVESCETARYFFSELALNDLYAQQSDYTKAVFARYKMHGSKPPRMHMGNERWSLKEKLHYIFHQIRTRSKNSFYLSPIFLRFKYDLKMIESKPDKFSAAIWWPIAISKKILGYRV